MREYITNLTNGLIGRHRFEVANNSLCRKDFFAHVKNILQAEDVPPMNPKTLGRIMDSFECGDLMVSRQELFSSLHFSGDGAELFRELVATCLAHAIVMRFHPEEAEGYDVPAYCRRKEKQ